MDSRVNYGAPLIQYRLTLSAPPHRVSTLFYLYAIRDVTGNRIYVGQCADLGKRLRQHNMGRVKSTRLNRPWALVAVQTFNVREECRWIEYQLKKSRGRRTRWLKAYAVPLDFMP